MEIEGKITYVSPVARGVSQASGKAWARQTAVAETHEQYPRRCAFTILGDERIDKFALTVGEECRVSFDINAREYNGRWYNDITAWNITGIAAQTQAQTQTQPQGTNAQAARQSAQQAAQPQTAQDDLPF